MGRDRSASLNYHSLIYGDARKKTDRSQNLSPMVPTRDQSLDLFQEQGEELFLLWKVVTVTLDGGGEVSILYCTVLGYLIIIMHAVFFTRILLSYLVMILTHSGWPIQDAF